MYFFPYLDSIQQTFIVCVNPKFFYSKAAFLWSYKVKPLKWIHSSATPWWKTSQDLWGLSKTCQWIFKASVKDLQISLQAKSFVKTLTNLMKILIRILARFFSWIFQDSQGFKMDLSKTFKRSFKGSCQDLCKDL